MRLWRPNPVTWRFDTPTVPPGVWLTLALVGAMSTEVYRYVELWTPLQRDYLIAYMRSAVAVSPLGEYDVWQIVDRTGSRFALDEDLVSVTTAAGETSFALAEPVAKDGGRLVVVSQTYAQAALHGFLRRWIYRDQTVFDLLVWPPLWAALALVLGSVIGARAQAVLDSRTSPPSSPAWSAPAPAVVIDHVDRPRPLSAPVPVPLHLPPSSHTGRRATPAATTPSAPADALPAHTAAPSSWPDPFFK
jgi:hypothetical protein